MTLVVSQRLDEAGRPLSQLILDSIEELARRLRLRSVLRLLEA